MFDVLNCRMYWQDGHSRADSPALRSTSSPPDLDTTSEFWKLINTLPKDKPVPPSIISLGLLTQHLQPYNETISVNTEQVPVQQLSKAIVPQSTLRGVRYVLARSTDDLNARQKELVGTLCKITGLNRPPVRGNDIEEVIQATTEKNPIAWPCFENEQANSGNDRDAQTDECDKKVEKSPNSSTKLNIECSHCSETFSEESEKDRHEIHCSEKTRKETYECPNCKRKFDNRKELHKHKNNCTNSGGNEKSATGSVGKSVKRDGRGERVTGKNPFADSDRLKDTGLHQGGE